ncbi:uncharacterized protein LOC124285093 [Haliotis rubra]|uniref:uncharacterized protein LOC124285093 n=1 Tax=Haliotis rubra TaxID=36100 RepID=UPI001EE57C3B|nr:uncharacterized protein LOC124285093 [Haliotis rubra]
MASIHLAAVIRPFFGNSDSVKCVVSEHGDTVYVKDVSLLLQLLDIEHPIGQLIVAVCQCHSYRYGSGVKSLLTLHGLLTEAFLSLCEQGIPPTDVITLMREALANSMCRLSALQIPLTNHLRATRHNSPHSDRTQCAALPAKSDDFKEVLMSDSGRRICKDGWTFIKSGSLDLKEMAETELIHLKMKQVRKDEDEDEDDIGWFFDDPVPSQEKKNEEAQVGLRINEECLEARDEIQLISRLSDADQHDSDFDDCFEDGPFSQGNAETKPTHVESFVNLNGRYSEGIDQKIVLDCSKLISSKNHTVTEVVEDDFDSCFEDRELENNVSIEAAVTDCTTERTEPDVKSLNSLLKRIKSTKIDNTNVFLSSHHFKQQAVSDTGISDTTRDVHTQPTLKLSVTDVHEAADGSHGDDMMPSPRNMENNFQSELDRLNKMIEKVKKCQLQFSETQLQTECSSTVTQHSITSSDKTKMLGLVNLKKISETGTEFKPLFQDSRIHTGRYDTRGC